MSVDLNTQQFLSSIEIDIQEMQGITIHSDAQTFVEFVALLTRSMHGSHGKQPADGDPTPKNEHFKTILTGLPQKIVGLPDDFPGYNEPFDRF